MTVGDRILIIDDRPDDVALTLRALKKNNITSSSMPQPVSATVSETCCPDGGWAQPLTKKVVRASGPRINRIVVMSFSLSSGGLIPCTALQ